DGRDLDELVFGPAVALDVASALQPRGDRHGLRGDRIVVDRARRDGEASGGEGEVTRGEDEVGEVGRGELVADAVLSTGDHVQVGRQAAFRRAVGGEEVGRGFTRVASERVGGDVVEAAVKAGAALRPGDEGRLVAPGPGVARHPAGCGAGRE